MKKHAKQPVNAYVIRCVLVLLTLAIVFCVTPFAPGQRSQVKFGGTLARSLLERLQPKDHHVQTSAASVKDRHLSAEAAVSASRTDSSRGESAASQSPRPSPTSSVQAIPSGIDCDTAPGIVIHDDGTVENGYGGGPGLTVIYADKFTPATYPTTYTSVCLAFNRLCAGPTSYPVEVVVFDDDGPGGSPGTELGAMPVTITNIPIFPDSTPVWNSFDISSLNIMVNDGSVYIGARWSSDTLAQVYMSSDENGPGS